jgi:hypothetical protein
MPRSDAVANLRRALTGACLKRSLGAMLLVGTVLNLINQWDFYFGAAEIDPWRMLLTYCVPFCVSTYGAFSAFQSDTVKH